MDKEEEEPESSMQSKMDLRKSKKPIMEKRRRARINQHLDELKNFILMNEKDPTRHSKLEKADILEMTVKRLQTMQREQLSTANPAMLAKFRSGFSECASEVSRFVSGLEDVEPAFKQRLLSHLHKCVNQMMPYGHCMPYMPERHAYPEVKVGFHGVFQNGDENNNNGSARVQIPSGVQLIPHRLPSGELAFLVPQSAGISTSFPFFPPVAESSANCIGQSSAFTAVARRSDSSLSLASSSISSSDESPHSEHPPATLSPNPQAQPRASQVKGLDASPAKSSVVSKSVNRSPETRKTQIGDRYGSPASEMPTRSELRPSDKPLRMDDKSILAEDCASRGQPRQPLSVITDQASNRIGQYDWSFDERKNLKKCHEDADEQLANSSKRARYEGAGNSQLKGDAFGEQSIDNLATRADGSTASEENSDRLPANVASRSFNANSDMWRPW